VFATIQTAPLDIRPDGRVLQGPPLIGSATEMPADGRPLFASHVLEQGRWPCRAAETFEAAFNAKLFEDRHVPLPALGSELPMMLQNGTVTLRIVGLYRADTLVKDFPSCYTTPGAMAEIARLNPRGPAGPTLALCAPPPKDRGVADLEALLDTVPEADACAFSTREAVVARFRSDTVANLIKQLPLSLSLAFITAAFMLVTVLTMGIAEHRRRIAMLRCVGMTRGGVALLTLAETAVLAIAGWALGLLAATALVQVFLLVEDSAELPRLVHVDWRAFALTGGLAMATALIADIAPALHAARVPPLEVAQGVHSDVRRISIPRASLGLALLLPIVLLSLPFDVTPMARIPFWSLLITSSGIATLLVASARAFRREIDVMRAIGMTRGQLARLFLGEVALVVLSAVAVSVAGGMLIGWSFTAVTRAQMAAGLGSALVVPWRLVGRGVLFAVVTTFAMGALPLRRLVRETGRG